jgi:hypothetical protein
MVVLKYNFLSFVISITLFFISPIYATESFQHELSISHSSNEDDDNFEVKTLDFGYSRYAKPISTDIHPNAEANFLERVGGITVIYSQLDLEAPGGSIADGSAYAISYTYMESTSPLLITGSFAKADVDSNISNAKITSDNIGLVVGRFIGQGRLVGLGYSTSELEAVEPGDPTFTAESNTLTLFTKMVKQHSDGTATNFELRFGNIDYETNQGVSETNKEFEILFDYYPENTIGVGAGLESNSGDDLSDEGKTITLRTQVFIDPKMAFSFKLEKFDSDNFPGDSSDEIEFGFVSRF